MNTSRFIAIALACICSVASQGCRGVWSQSSSNLAAEASAARGSPILIQKRQLEDLIAATLELNRLQHSLLDFDQATPADLQSYISAGRLAKSRYQIFFGGVVNAMRSLELIKANDLEDTIAKKIAGQLGATDFGGSISANETSFRAGLNIEAESLSMNLRIRQLTGAKVTATTDGDVSLSLKNIHNGSPVAIWTNYVPLKIVDL